jgi:hypothetical protein
MKYLVIPLYLLIIFQLGNVFSQEIPLLMPDITGKVKIKHKYDYPFYFYENVALVMEKGNSYYINIKGDEYKK